ncbi:MAG: efflux transporter outer membrane subunit [Gammaproteobacteria bacterium]|nr:efflux transporter outer membrane subunit [Gammaproteobacteria bacterium]
MGAVAATAITISTLAAGCINVAPTYERPPIELPADWANATGQSTAAVGGQWWKIYGDATLDQLVDEALTHNANLQLAVARVDEARALLGQARAEQFPSIDARLDRSRTQSSERGAMPLPPGVERETDTFRAAANVSYELDFWGRLRNASTAARAELLATEAAQETVRIALAADVVQSYFTLRALDEQVAATHRSIDARAESLALQRKRFEAGAISEFDYRQLEAENLAALAQLPVLERNRAQQELALAVLLGKSPRIIYEGKVTIDTATTAEDQQPPALVVPAGLPSELLLRRPDLIESENRLIAADARIGVARAAYFPSISLTGYIGSESAVLRDLFTGPAGIWQAAASLTQPIWGGGRLGSQVDAANARQRQALAQYQSSIQNAFRDVRGAIIAQTKTREQFDAENLRVAALRETLRLAKLRYQNGVASQLDVLDAERGLLAAELSRSDARRAQRGAIADLFKALGGGWSTKP